ncbi:hypothetical protein D7B24_002552 [Verticillium nonalfalfae]|uniref:DUF4470 domain-containing protein n=1 Tax=Verticillium nonalfalfae TaxID=1051616 RepID=A0A3M9XYL1_9PEZI|nr:uncharacterized protein D7B24_002552 [Verticillium nonalfalfae]RNJ53015.1 hypothetical protein D7B24_002552 [Verticillium nonalfalfae]
MDSYSLSREPGHGPLDLEETTKRIDIGIRPLPAPTKVENSDEQQLAVAFRMLESRDFAGAESAAVKGVKMRVGKHKFHPELYALLAEIKMAQGQVEMAYKYAEKALEGWHAARHPDNITTLSYLRNLLASRHLTNLDLVAARPYLDVISPQTVAGMSKNDVTEHDVYKLLQLCLEQEPSRNALKDKIKSRIPLCKPAYTWQTPYDPNHTEPARPLVDAKLLSGDGPFNLFLAGPGDGRHFFATVIEAAKLASQRKMENVEAVPQQLHLTICDHHPAAIGRLLVMLQLMETESRKFDEQDREVYSASLAFVFSSPIIPHRAAEAVRAAASLVNYALHNWNNPKANLFHDYIQMSKSTREQVASFVTKWWEPCDQGYSLQIVNDTILKSNYMNQLQQNDPRKWLAMFPNASLSTQAETEISNHVGILGLPKCFVHLDSDDEESDDEDDWPAFGGGDPRITDEQLYKMIQQYHALCKTTTGSASARDQQRKDLVDLMRTHITLSWKVNATMLAEDVDRFKGNGRRHKTFAVPKFAGCYGVAVLLSVMGLVPKVDLENPTNALNALQVFFRSFWDSFKQIRGSLKLHFVLGDAIDVLDQLRLGLPKGEHESDNSGFQGIASQALCKFDRVDLSSVADASGGLMAIFLTVPHVLKSSDNGFQITFTAWEGTLEYRSHVDYLNEFLGLQRRELIPATYGLTLDEVTQKLVDEAPRSDQARPLHMGMPMGWNKIELKTPLTVASGKRNLIAMMLDQHLLTLCLSPHPRSTLNRDKRCHRTHSLNLSSYFRLVAQLSDRGLDPHLLFQQVARILTPDFETKARFPTEIWSFNEPDYMSGKHMDREFTCINLRPWHAELSTLAVIWQRLLNFSIVTSKLTLQDVSRFELLLDSDRDIEIPNPEAPEFVIVFVKEHDQYLFDGSGLAMALARGESPDEFEFAEFLRNNSHVVTTWKWDGEKQVASFWLRSDVVDDMLESSHLWNAFLYRSDDWNMCVDGPFDMACNILRKCEPWLQGEWKEPGDNVGDFLQRWVDDRDGDLETEQPVDEGESSSSNIATK